MHAPTSHRPAEELDLVVEQTVGDLLRDAARRAPDTAALVEGVAVVGVPDDHWGEVPAGFVRLRAGAAVDGDDLASFARERLARHKVPRIWRFVPAFTVTGSGKVRKFALRDALLAET